VFRRTPRLSEFPPYPGNTRFGPFHISYEQDLSEMVTEQVFLYANSTDTAPPAPAQLTRIAGVGSSPVVTYDGTGAYFLDKLAEGTWQLEIYPDAVWVDDPFARTSLQREVSRVLWRRRTIDIRLPDLGQAFHCRKLAPEAEDQTVLSNGTLDVEPGIYQLTREGAPRHEPPSPVEFHAPRQARDAMIVWWQCPDRWRAGTPLPVQVVIADAAIHEVLLHGSRSDGIVMKRVAPYSYGTIIPGDELAGGVCSLGLEVIRATETEPSAAGNGKEIELLPADSPVPLFVADHQQVRLEGQVDRRSKMVAGSRSDRKAVQVSVGSFEPAPAAVHFRNVVPPYMSAWHGALADCNVVVLTARALTEDTDRLELVLLETDTAPWGTEVSLTTEWQEIVVPLDRLRFFSHWSHPAQRGGEGDHFDPRQVNAVNICFGVWLYGPRSSQPHGFEIESILLGRRDLDKAD
jgi:hypothetical protein